jgi:hypothetical protein
MEVDMADDSLGFEALRPVIESQMAFMQGAMKFNVAVMQAWLGMPGRDEAQDERPSVACKNAEFLSP